MAGDLVGTRAVVLGGGMAGLLAARVLSETCAEVVVVDRDETSGVNTPRRGVPQGRHVHGLLARGQQILEELFPGFTEGAVAAGIPTGDLGELRWYFDGRRLQPATTGLTCVSATRPVLEGRVRARVAALPNVTFAERRDIVGLTMTSDRRRVTGVRLHDHDTAASETLDADLVVDATGRGSRTPAWLAETGYPPPTEERIRIGLTYTTRHYRLRSDEAAALDGELAVNSVATPSRPRGAFLSRIENGRCVLSLTGVLGDRPPTDPAGFLDYARSLPVPDIHQIVHDAQPVNEPVSFHFPASVRRRYERLPSFPDRLLVIGDAVCVVNPVYGQGMTIAALEARTLRDHLVRGLPEAKSFFRDVAAVLDVPWDISAGGDLAFPGVAGRRTARIRLGNAYLSRLRRAATRDGAVTGTFMRVAGLVDPPGALMRPGVMLRVLGRPGRSLAGGVARPPEVGRAPAG